MAMEVFRSLEEWAARFGASGKSSALTVGNFDGLHLGHQAIVRAVVGRARALDAVAAAVTFDPHPLKLLRPGKAPPLVSTLAQRLAGLEQMGLDAVLVLTFDLALSRLAPEDFVRRILIEGMRMRAILVGGNFRFGHRQAGDVAVLKELGRRWGFAVENVAPVVVSGQVVSSTAVRQAVSEGRVGEAAQLLGRPFALTGEIRPGSGRGQKLVFPTLNLAPEQELLPRIGVYATEVRVAGGLYRAATNVGVRPTFDAGGITVESHLFDFSETLSAGAMEVGFWERLRDERKFSGPEELRAQISEDIHRAKEFFRQLDLSRTAPRDCGVETRNWKMETGKGDQ